MSTVTPALNADAVLGSVGNVARPDEDQWRQIVSHLVASLEKHLRTSIRVENLQITAGTTSSGFDCDIAASQTSADALGFSWFGRLGTVLLGDAEQYDTRAWLFPRCQGQRVVTPDGGAFLEFFYDTHSSGDRGAWTGLGWQRDVHFEFESWR